MVCLSVIKEPHRGGSVPIKSVESRTKNVVPLHLIADKRPSHPIVPTFNRSDTK